MTEVEVSLCDQNYRGSFPDRFVTVEKDSEKKCNKSFSLRIREERVSLLRAGFTGKGSPQN